MSANDEEVPTPPVAKASTENDLTSPNRKLSAGEYCTMVRANELGILDADRFKKGGTVAPFNGLYKDLKTFNPDIDTYDRRTKSLCKETITGEAYPHCTGMYGPGFVKKGTSDANNPYKCEIYQCPPGFQQQGQYCNKESIFEDAKIDKRSKCEERWSDWFVIPNYHLGNKFYEERVGKCFAPCPVNHVPNFVTDPADGSRMNMSGEDDPAKCVPRDQYFAGKYAQGTDYCPLAWIMRVYAMNPQNARDLIYARRSKISQLYDSDRDPKKNRATQVFRNVARVDGQDLLKEAAALSKQMGTYLENINPPEEAQAQACGGLNSGERLADAYRICESLSNQGTLELHPNRVMNAKMNVVLKQACNAVFCNEQNNALDIVGKNPICFKETRQLTDEELAELEDKVPEPYSADEEKRFFMNSVKSFLVLILLPIVLVVLGFLITRFVWPTLVRPVWHWIYGFFTGRQFTDVKFRDARHAEIEFQRGQIIKARKAAEKAAMRK